MINRKIKKITLIKSATLCCEKCKYGYDNNRCRIRECNDCKMHGKYECICVTIKNGQPCPYFERYEKEGAEE